jgi:peptidyl-dipeptidase A
VTDAEALVDQLTRTLAPLERAVNETWWAVATDATDEHTRAHAAAELALSDALADPAAAAALAAARTHDPLLERQLAVLTHLHLPHQVPGDLRARIVELQASVGARFAQHRGMVDGEPVDDNTIAAILRTSDDDGLRRRAWEASKTVGAEVADDVRELARLRNEAARALGFRDHVALALAASDFDEDRLFTTLAEVDRLTAAPFAAWKAALDDRLAERFDCAPDDLAPHHYADPFFQEAPAEGSVGLDEWFAGADLEALTVRTFAGVGLDVAGVLGRSDLRPRPGKNQHAFCVDVDRAGDVRVLSNNVGVERWAETMLHEFGHAAYFLGVDAALPWALRTMDMCLTEGVAMLCGRLVRDPEWLRSVAGLPAATVDSLVGRLAAARRAELLVFARWVLVMTHFERGLYADPEGDHDARWWDLVERYQLLRRPHGRHAPDWAAKVHIALAPVYYHNYLYGEMVASQLAHALGGRSPVGRHDAGTWLRDRVFAPGASSRWDRLIEQATGAALSPAALARDLAA